MKHILSLLFYLPIVFGAKWRTHDHNIYKNDIKFSLKGTNWFGYETDCKIVNGLWVHPMTWYLDFMKTNNFNAIRIPFSYELAMNLEESIQPLCLGDEGFHNVKDSLNFLFIEANKRDIQILLDFHSINGNINQYPLDNITSEQFYQAWFNMIDIGIQHDNFMAIDIKNEPHEPTTLLEWSEISNNAISTIKKKYPKYDGLFFIQGTQGDDNNAVWGGSFTGNNVFNIDDRVIFSPHTYGPSVIGERGNLFDENYFHNNFGFLLEQHDNAICISETGGTMNTTEDIAYFNRLSKYLKHIDQTSLFWWCINPNSFDTAGLLEADWTTPVNIKLNWLTDLNPTPTFTKRNLRTK